MQLQHIFIMAQDYILFFSNFCNYSKDVVGVITRKNIRNAFVFVCVDTVRPIPPFVTCVPLITSRTNKAMYVDEQIMELLDHIAKSMYPPTQIEAMNSMSAFSADNTESEFESFGQDNGNFSMLDMDHFRINTINEDEEVKCKRADSSQLEQFIAQRDSDVKRVSDRPNLMWGCVDAWMHGCMDALV